MKPIYFISDAHLGSRAIEHRRTQERRLVRFLDDIKDKAAAVYMLGDMFDFWFEWKNVVPRGFTRFLGKISELTDNGVEVHYFIGNHDIWAFEYLEKECGVHIHRHPLTTEIYGRDFYLAHGDGMGDPSKSFKLIRSVFHNKVCQWMFGHLIHPNSAMNFGLSWAKHSRQKQNDGKDAPYMGEDKEHLVLYTKEYMKEHSDVDFYIYGHRHIELDLMLSRTTRMIILGDWINNFTYAVWDGENMFVENYIEGETEL